MSYPPFDPSQYVWPTTASYASGDECDDNPLVAALAQMRSLALYDLLKLRLQRVIAVPTPNAGGEITVSVPAGATWELLGLRGQLVTSAVAGNRAPTVQILSGGVVLEGVASSGAQAASTTFRHGWYVDATAAGTFTGNLDFSAALPRIIAQGSDTVRTVTSVFDGGDQWGNISLVVRDWSVGHVYWTAELLARELGNETGVALPRDVAEAGSP